LPTVACIVVLPLLTVLLSQRVADIHSLARRERPDIVQTTCLVERGALYVTARYLT
jgi:hypothetical protein